MSENPDSPGPAIWTDSYKINSFEVDPTRRATVQTLCKFMQESAWNHAGALKLGFSQMQKRALMWAISRLKIQIYDLPRWGQTVRIKTWPAGIYRLFALRDFQILNEASGLMAEATSAWLILDESMRRPTRIEPLFQEMKIPMGKNLLEGCLEKLPSPQEPQTHPFFPVRFSDLDWYNHVNHTRYVQWILDAYSVEFHGCFQVSSLEIDFLSETRYGDEVSIRTQELKDSPPSFLHSILRKKENHEICIARVSWKKTD